MLNEKLTVVMLNWARPANVIRFAAEYLRMPVVAGVIVFDCSGRLDEDEFGSRVLFVRAVQGGDPGLPARFAAAALARTRDVLIVDDDIELPEATVNALYDAYCELVPGKLKQPQAVGLFGRRPAADGTYNIETCYGVVPILLTRAVVTSRRRCALALAATMEMAQDLGGEPFGNGEDIVLSHVGRGYNLAVDLPYRNVGYDDANAISVRYKRHEQHRTDVVRWCRQRKADGGL